MKKLILMVIAIAFVAGVSHAADLSGIAFIDVQRVFKEYKETSKAQGDLAKQEESFKKDFEEGQKALAKAEKDGKKKEELDKLRKELEEKLTPKRDSLLRMNEQLTGKIQLDIVAAVKTVAKKVGVNIVLDKQVVITGGMDVTDMVVAELNK